MRTCGSASGEILVSAGGGAAGKALLESGARGPPRRVSGPPALASHHRHQPARGRFRGAAGERAGRRRDRAVPPRFRGAAARLPGFGQPGRLQHRPGPACGAGARGAGAVRRRARDRAACCGPSGWPRSALRSWCARASCRRRRWPRRSSARRRARGRSLAIDTGGAARSAQVIADMIGARRAGRRPFCRARQPSYCRAMTAPPLLDPMTERRAARDGEHGGRGLGRSGRRARPLGRGGPDRDAVVARRRRGRRDPAACDAVARRGRDAGGAGGDPGTARPRIWPLLSPARPRSAVLQHGWRHANRARSGKKSEFPSGLSASVAAAEIAAGRDRLAALFGSRALPVFVPPWNRFAPELLAVARRIRYRGRLDDRLANKARQFDRPCRPDWA